MGCQNMKVGLNLRLSHENAIKVTKYVELLEHADARPYMTNSYEDECLYPDAARVDKEITALLDNVNYMTQYELEKQQRKSSINR